MKTDKTENKSSEDLQSNENTSIKESTKVEAEQTKPMTDEAESMVAEAEAASQAAGEKIPVREEEELRLTPVNPDLVEEKPAPAVGDKRGEATIAAIAAAMDIDVRIAHALVDIHAGVDSAEAFARAYGIDNPAAIHTAHASSDQTLTGQTGDIAASRSDDCDRLPDEAKSVPTFLCNPRRGFWE